MADEICTAQYFKITTADKPGEGARVLTAFQDAGVNLVAFSGFPRARRGQLDLIPSDPAAFKAAAKQAKLKIEGPKLCFLVNGDDRPGAGAELLSKLAAARINVTALQEVSGGGGRYGAIFWVKPRDVREA
jgi:hypothetical protein